MSAKHIAIVPARAGSKGIEDKNLIKLAGKTLVKNTIDKLFESKVFSQVILTTDYPRQKLGIEEVAGNGWTKFEFIKRPAALSRDEVPIMDAILHVINQIGNDYTYVWLFQPTSPFTRVEDILKVKNLLEKQGAKSVISFKEVKEHSNRFYTMKEKEEFIEAYKMRYTNFVARQKLMTQYIRSGNIYAISREDLVNSKSLEAKPIAAHFVDRVIGLNIDDYEDVVLAKYWLSLGRVKI